MATPAPDPPSRSDTPRPLWMTAIMVSVGVVGAPLAILGIALAIDRGGAAGRSGILLSYFGFVGLSIPLTVWRTLRPLGVGMLLGSFALVLMFFATGGLSTDTGGSPGTL